MPKHGTDQWFTTLTIEGSLLSMDFLRRLALGDKGDCPGTAPENYDLSGGRLADAVNPAWTRARSSWLAFQNAVQGLPDIDSGVALTRDKWLQQLFIALDYGKLPAAQPEEIDGRVYPVSHRWNRSFPVHLVSFRQNLDRRPEQGGWKPHSLMQEYLNRSEQVRWGIVSNGYSLRLLRDSARVTRPSYIEFDLKTMFETGAYADFTLLWLLCHRSRIEGEKPEDCWLEKWFEDSRRLGARALDSLRTGVENAICRLGIGFLRHPDNRILQRRLRDGELNKQDFFRQLLRMTYRLLFLFVAEDRELLMTPETDEQAKADFYYYSTTRLRELSRQYRSFGRHSDLGNMVGRFFRMLENGGIPQFGIASPGGFLWSPQAMPDLSDATIANCDLLWAFHDLAWMESDHVMRPVDYRNLGSEELGSVFEALLELHPIMDLDAKQFKLDTAAGNDRKSTGSYYTPDSLIQCLLDSALEPVLDKAARSPNPVAALERIKICDPACGSGHFLVAAAHRIAKRLAAARTMVENAENPEDEHEPSPEDIRDALRHVIGDSLYGVDINDMAVELCKVALWMEAQDPRRPLSFLDHHIVQGNSLLGATPKLLDEGIPETAFEPLEGDDRKECNILRKENENQRRGWQSFPFGHHEDSDLKLGNMLAAFARIDEIPDTDRDGARAREVQYYELTRKVGYQNGKLWADSWCGAFVWKKVWDHDAPPPVLEKAFRDIEKYAGHGVPLNQIEEVRRLAHQYGFMAWHMTFPGVFRLVPKNTEKPADWNADTGWAGGFDCVLGNPPWERVKLQEKEWFASRVPEIANASNAAARKQLIAALAENDPTEYTAFLEERRKSEGESALLRNSGRYPLCGRGDVNTYSVFAELMRSLIKPGGRVGCIVPSGLATDDTLKHFFRDLVDTGTLASFYDFENRSGLFPAVDSRMKFALVTLKSGRDELDSKTPAEFAFFLHNTEELRNPERRFILSAEDLKLLNPNTHTSPIFRSRKDAELTKYIYRRVPVLWREASNDAAESNPWGVSFRAMFHMSNDSGLFHTKRQLEAEGWSLSGNVFERGGERMLPLYEAKMVHHFDHRWAGYVPAVPKHGKISTKEEDVISFTDKDKKNPNLVSFPRYWVPESDVRNRLGNRWTHEWLLGWRDICRSTDERTTISGVIPFAACGDKFLLIFPQKVEYAPSLIACFDSFCFDFCTRQKHGGTSLKYYLFKQLPVPSPTTFEQRIGWLGNITLYQWILPRIIELVSTSHDTMNFANDFGCYRWPFRWIPQRRKQLCAELDAVFFHLFLGSQGEWNSSAPKELCAQFPSPRNVISHIMDSFLGVKKKDLKEYGHYHTCEAILTEYDRMAAAIATGVPYVSTLSPKPGQQLEAPLVLQGPTSLPILYTTFVLDLFTVRPEIEKRTFRNLRSLIGYIFTVPDKILSGCISPQNEVRRHIDAVRFLLQRDSTGDLDKIIYALTKAGAIVESTVFAQGPHFDESRAEYPSAESITWLVQEFLRIEDRGAQLVAGDELLDSSAIASDEDAAPQVRNEQMADLMPDKLSIKE